MNLKTQYKTKLGRLYLGDAIDFLKSLDSESVDLVFADPPYNLNKESWDKFGTDDEYMFWTLWWVKEVSRILKSTGSVYICGFSEILAEVKFYAKKYFSGCRWLVWAYKNKANMRNDWGRSHESIIHFRKSNNFVFNTDEVRIPYSEHTLKYPEKLQSNNSQYNKYGNGINHKSWQPNPNGARPRDVIDLPTINNGSKESTEHPAQKPEELLRKIILASSNVGALVVDPFSGSGTTLITAQQLGRKWLGCDNNQQYNQIAIDRLKGVEAKGAEYWIEMDRKNCLRRG